MSDLQRDFLRHKLSKLPPPSALFPPLSEDPLPTESSRTELNTTLNLTAAIPPSPPSPSSPTSSASTASEASIVTVRGHASSRSELAPLPWTEFFDEKREVEFENGKRFNIYLLRPGEGGMLYAMHHGAGSSGLSFAVLARELKRADPKIGVLAVDCRGHGESLGAEDGEFGLETLSEEFGGVVGKVVGEIGVKEVILVGHSLGGAVVTELAKKGMLGKAVVGYAVFDVVEGSAVEALASMGKYLEGRPHEFKGVEEGIDWHLRSRTIRNTNSARASVPALLARTPTGTYTWKTDLARTQPFWNGWFQGLSSKFLSARGGKLLVLAGTDRLDKELMIGQMMGKYQLVVLPEAGHFLHEDLPVRVASVLTEFARRQAPIVLPPKVGQGYGI